MTHEQLNSILTKYLVSQVIRWEFEKEFSLLALTYGEWQGINERAGSIWFLNEVGVKFDLG